MRRLLFGSPWLLVWIILPAFPGFPQDGDAAPYLIPQTIFVGDTGRLLFPLKTGDPGGTDAVIQGAGLPRSKDLVINRVEFEHRGTSVRLLVDFQAYAPGRIALPPITIASRTFTGLEVTISSILDLEQRGMVLSEPAGPLAAPGTAALIYGTILGIIVLLLALTLGAFLGKTRLRGFAGRLRRRRVIRAMGRSLRRRQAALPGGEGKSWKPSRGNSGAS